MTLHLSSADIAAVEHANTVLLSAFAYRDGGTWRRAAALAVEACLDGDGSSFALPIAGEPMIAASPPIERALDAILPPPSWIVDGLTARRRALGLTVADWDELFDARIVRRTPFYHEVVRPQGLMAPLVMLTETGEGALPAALSVYFTNERSARGLANRRKEILRLIFPAFVGGVRAFIALRRNSAALEALAEDAAIGVLVFDAPGHAACENAFFQQLMCCEPERERVRAEVRHVIQGAANLAAVRAPRSGVRRSHSELRTAAARYRITATFLHYPRSSESTMAVALVDRVDGNPTHLRDLAARFSLTAREVEVGLLLRAGLSTRQIAAQLGISINTARRHIERIMLKLDVHNRVAAAAALTGG